MLGDDDIGVLIDEPITAADLFGEDEGEIRAIPPLDEGDENAQADAPPDGEAPAADAAAEPKQKRKQNRLANLNEKWVTDPKREGMYTVNKYFENVKLKPGKGNELKTLNTVLRRYEYWAQQCYPKFCFKDVVNKLEYLSAKKPIKNALSAIRNNINPFEDIGEEDNGAGDANGMGMNPLPDGIMDDGDGLNPFPPIVNDVPSTPTQHNDVPSTPTQHSFDSFAAPPQPITASSSTPIAEDMKELIRKKREAAIAKRKRKIEESMNMSASSSASQATGGEASLDISSITIPESGGPAKKAVNDDLEVSLNYSMSSAPDVGHEKVLREESPLNSTSLSTQPREKENDANEDNRLDCSKVAGDHSEVPFLEDGGLDTSVSGEVSPNDPTDETVIDEHVVKQNEASLPESVEGGSVGETSSNFMKTMNDKNCEIPDSSCTDITEKTSSDGESRKVTNSDENDKENGSNQSSTSEITANDDSNMDVDTPSSTDT